jgi:MFS family permease
VAIGLGMIGMSAVALTPSFPLMVIALVPVGMSAGVFLAVDWALMTDIIPKATTGRYMGISNVATAISGPIARVITGVLLTVLVLVGLPPGLDSTENAASSSLYAAGPRIAIALTLVFFVIAAWTLRHVDETRREDCVLPTLAR